MNFKGTRVNGVMRRVTAVAAVLLSVLCASRSAGSDAENPKVDYPPAATLARKSTATTSPQASSEVNGEARGSGQFDFLQNNFVGGNSSGSLFDAPAPIHDNSGAMTLDSKTQKRLWEQWDQHRHWMFGGPDASPEFGRGMSTGRRREFDPATDDDRSFVPSSSRPRSVIQKQALEEGLNPNRKGNRTNPEGEGEQGSGNGNKSQGPQPLGSAYDAVVHEAIPGGSFLDWFTRRGAHAAGRGEESVNLGNAVSSVSEGANMTRDRGQRISELLDDSGVDTVLRGGRSEMGGLDSTSVSMTHRERLENLFDNSPVPESVLSVGRRPAVGQLDASSLGRAQRDELFGNSKDDSQGSTRRAKILDDASKRPVFRPQPGELPLPKPNGL